MILNSRGLKVDGSWGRVRGESGSSGWSLFLRGDGLLGFGAGLAGDTEVLSGTGVWSGLLIDVGVILGRRIRLLVLCRFEVGGLRAGLVSRGLVLEVLSVVGVLGGALVGGGEVLDYWLYLDVIEVEGLGIGLIDGGRVLKNLEVDRVRRGRVLEVLSVVGILGGVFVGEGAGLGKRRLSLMVVCAG